MDATKWTQGFQEMINIKPMEQLLPNNNTNTYIATTTPRPNATASNATANATASNTANNNNNTERKVRPQEKLNCPRCNSTNTKFCYYNNYSLTQPRYFCKGCRRYWTEGGSLRNVPVGGSSRKNKRSSLPSSSSSLPSLSLPSSFSKLPDLNPPILFSKTSKGSSQDLNLMSFPLMQDHHHHHHALELLRSNGGVNSMMDPNTVLYSSLGFPTIQDYKQSNNLSFSIDHHQHHNHHQGIGHNTNHHQQQQSQEEMNGTSRILFPFSDTTQVHDDDNQQHKNHGNGNNNNNSNNNHNNNNYWSGMFSNTGGSSW